MHDKKQGKFMEGFFWGGLIGGGFAYLLSTQKGRDFLKDIIQSGVDMLDSATMPQEESLNDTPIVEEIVVEQALEAPSVQAPVEPKVVASHPRQEETEVKKTRFFKKSPKK